MKKTLIALATLAAAGTSFAQSSVTIYGQFDAGVYSLGKANGTDSRVVYGDGATFSNVLGFRGSEDLGGGLRANFQAETDIQTNNGGTNQNGLFRRQAHVGLAGGFGEIRVGTTLNPIIATNGALVPVGGNSVMTSVAGAVGYADFFTKNAVTYTLPTINGLTAQIQQGFSNNIESSSAGSVLAGSLAYVNGPLSIRYAMQDRKEAAIGAANSGANASSASAPALNRKSSVLGVRYQMGAVSVGAAMVQSKSATAIGGALTTVDGSILGVGYTTGAWTLGANYAQAEKSTLTNLQARYALSKRTNLIAQAGFADNHANGLAKFSPIAFNTGSAPATITDTYAATAGKKQNGVGIGITHSF
jgi:predicted porin